MSGSKRHPEQTTVQVFARDTRRGEDAAPVFLPRGEADRFRADARAGFLICPLDECSNRRFIVRAGSRRDHFAHRRGAGGHGTETLQHHTAKHLIGRWLREHYPDASIDVDTKEIENGRRPDVLLTLADRRRVGYEVQFASMTAAAWTERHLAYVEQGIRDVWLFGGRHYDKPPRSRYAREDAVDLSPVFDAVLAHHHPILLINPAGETVAFVTGQPVEGRPLARGLHPEWLLPLGREAIVEHRWSIEQARAAAGVIDLPGLRELMGGTDDEHHAQ